MLGEAAQPRSGHFKNHLTHTLTKLLVRDRTILHEMITDGALVTGERVRVLRYEAGEKRGSASG